MLNSKDILKQANIVPKLRLAVKKEKGGTISTGPHRVKILSDKVGKDLDPDTGKERHVMIYYVEENGEKRMYKVPVKDKVGNVHYLVQRLSEIEEGEEVVLEFKRKGVKGYIEVVRTTDVSSVEVDDEDDDLPVIRHDDEEIESDNGKGGTNTGVQI